jgi:host factor-I protein
MSQLPPSNQSEMLASMQADGSKVSIFLVNGIRLVGQIDAFDQYIIVLRSSSGAQTIYKHAVSTVQLDSGRSATFANSRPRSERHHDGDSSRTTGLGLRKRSSPSP